MEADAKPWQHGYPLEALKALEERYEFFNSFALSPFGEMKKHTIAAALAANRLVVEDDFILETFITKTSGSIRAYLDVVIAHKEKGDRIIDNVTIGPGIKVEKLTNYLRSFTEPTWLWVWMEDALMKNIATSAGYTYVASKVTSFAEIKGLYFKDGKNQIAPREHPMLDRLEYIGIKQVPTFQTDIEAALKEIAELDMDFTNHYSNYNKGKSWSALSLRGYTVDPSFITKPSEMSAKWQEENKTTHFELQDTPLREKLPGVENVHKAISNLSTPHRIRLMRLAPGGGELKRHTDQVDKDTGVKNGQLMRFHFPLITNEDVIFTSWNMQGDKTEVNMKPGEAWYLDTRKPHMAVNNGSEERIHLVVDIEANGWIRGFV